MRVLVTGAAGFVGKHLVPRLTSLGWEVDARDQDLDVADAEAVDAALALRPPDAVVHLAAQSSVSRSLADPAATYRVNFLGARFLLRGIERRAPHARVLLIGSGDQYGSAPPGTPAFTEASPFRPRSPYARSKAAADLLGAAFAERGLAVVRTRAFNHAGPGQTDVFVASSFARQIAEMEAGRRDAVLRVGNLDSVRDFLDVGDVVEAYLHLLDARVPVDAYNVASSVGVRVRDLLDGLLSLTEVRPRIEVAPERVRPTDVSVGDAGRLRGATAWQPRVPLGETLERLLEGWRAALAAT